jgi:hypothetical protein
MPMYREVHGLSRGLGSKGEKNKESVHITK